MSNGLEMKAAFVEMKLLFKQIVREVTRTIDVCTLKHESIALRKISLRLLLVQAAVLRGSLKT